MVMSKMAIRIMTIMCSIMVRTAVNFLAIIVLSYVGLRWEHAVMGVDTLNGVSFYRMPKMTANTFTIKPNWPSLQDSNLRPSP